MKKKVIETLFVTMTTVALVMGCTSNALETTNMTVVSEDSGFLLEEEEDYEELEVYSSINNVEQSGSGFVISDEPWYFDDMEPRAVSLDEDEFVSLEREYTLTNDLFIYNIDGMIIGYALKGEILNVTDGNKEWLRVYNKGELKLKDEFFFVKAMALDSATADDVVILTKEENNIEVEEAEVLVDANTEETKPAVIEDKEESKPSTTKPVTEEPVVTESVVTEPVAVEPEPVVETPVVSEPEVPVVDNTKYTPEEAVAVYRSIMEANGISWNPALKNGGSWGTGWIYLTKGQPEWAGNSSVESFRMGDGDGIPWRSYYLEVTGYDENAVYITGWHN